MSIKQILRHCLFLPLCYYIYISQNYDNNILIRESIDNNFLSEKISFDKEGEVNQEVSIKQWPFKNRLDNELLLLSIKFDTIVDFRQSDLRFKLSIYTNYQDSLLNRLILNEFVNYSDETIFNEYQIQTEEFPIGLIPNLSSESIIINLKILQADKKLSKANPKLKIEAYKGSDYVYGYAGLGLLIKNIVLAVSILCVIIYIVIGLRNEAKFR